jgi:hypothetical protein
LIRLHRNQPFYQLAVLTFGRSDQFVISTVQPKEGEKTADGLSWYGPLVPGSLKKSQANFKKCLRLTIEIANVKAQLESLYNTLSKQLSE